MKVLVACEFSGIVREAFHVKGHDSWSCDLLDTEIPGQHIKDDIRHHLDENWDLMIAHPPCTYLAGSGLHWNSRIKERDKLTHQAMLFVFALLDAEIPKIALENPVGCISTNYRKPDQIIQPYMFGHPESKKTCLWLKNLPKLIPTNRLADRERWDNQTPSGQNRLTPSSTRARDRSRTYLGIATAMAEQWG
jgi:hypothetical protein